MSQRRHIRVIFACPQYAIAYSAIQQSASGFGSLANDGDHQGNGREQRFDPGAVSPCGAKGRRTALARRFRNGRDWSERYPRIVEAALRNLKSSFVTDGEAVLLWVDGRSDFNGLHSRRHDDEVQFYAFDMLLSDGEDLRKLPLSMRKTNLARLLVRRVDGIHLAPFE